MNDASLVRTHHHSPIISAGELVAILGNGVSQIFIVSHPLAGLLILVGIAIHSLPMAVAVAVGMVLTTLMGALSGQQDRGALRAGLSGYNGALIGASSYVTWDNAGEIALSIILCATAAAIATQALGWLFARPGIARLQLPVLTAPFCISAGLMAALALGHTAAESLTDTVGARLPVYLDIVLSNISQVLLIDNPITGAFIVAGLLVASWRVGLAAVIGAAAEMVIGLVAGVAPGVLAEGLGGYSGVLVAIAVGAVFIESVWWVRALAVLLGIALVHVVGWLLTATSVPVYTWPFVLATWIVLGAYSVAQSPAGKET